MASLFGANPFSTPVGQRIEKATDSILPSEDWALIIEICDIINETEEGPKDAIKAFRKRLAQHKNSKIILYSVTALEACVKNCGHRFHILLANKDVLSEFPKILGQKGSHQVPQVLQEKILQVIQSWSDAFRNAPDLQAIVQLYDQLKAHGYEFPAQDLDTLSPIYTPERSVQAPAPDATPPSSTVPQPSSWSSSSVRDRQRQQPQPLQQPLPQQQVMVPAGPVQPTAEQLAKLRSELDIVQNNSQVMAEMLTELKPGEEDPADWVLLQELNGTCRQMQQRLVELLQSVANEEVTGELLRVNDVLNNLFLRYDRFERQVKAISGRETDSITGSETGQTAAEQQLTRDQGNMLIDFGEEVSSQPPSGAVPARHDDFDMFAQSRSSTFTDSRRGGSTYDDNSVGVPVNSSIAGAMNAKGPYPAQASPAVDHKEINIDVADDIQDVEEWLKDSTLNESGTDASQEQANAEEKPTGVDATVSSAEFDEFLNERSLAGPQRVATVRQPVARQMNNMAAGDKDEDPMFAL